MMQIINKTDDKITIEFDLLSFLDLQDFFEEQKDAVDSTGKFNYEAIQKFVSIKIDNSTLINEIRLKRIDQLLLENKKLINQI